MKKELIMIFGLFFILISLGFASAQTCYTTTYNSCVGNEDNVIMRFSETTNAHGETTATYNSVLCCDFGSGSTSCTGNNAIIRLSATGNAHAEIINLASPVYTSYYSCYDSLRECRGTTSNCDVNEIEILYLSDYTNAHLGASGYSTRICCQVNLPPDESCILTSATWSEESVIEGSGVGMNLVGVNCSGANINFSIYEWDGTHRYSMTGTFPSILWTTQRFGGEYDYNERIYYFTGTVIGAGESTATSGNLTVLPNIDCNLYITCPDYDTAEMCLADPCVVAGSSHYNSSLCDCEWDGAVCNDVCEETDPDTGEGVGRCVYANQVITNTCEEDPVGFLTFSWNAGWLWDENCDAQCRIDNADKEAACSAGSKTIECPAQILLPFFGAYSMIISVLAIAMIYVVLGILKKRKIHIRFK
ncbi:hypothetical protein FJZ20_00745 [Candidatus Pacearchaeota archaeon]|nr:hypothetical protein [Candidatus Pacearchaeota archaeon]